MKIFISAILTMATLIIYAQESQETTPKWTSGRPDGHAPMSVMGDHMHGKGQWMFGYRFMSMTMDDLKEGSTNIDYTYAQDTGYMVVPKSMDMTMHMLSAMYAPTDKITLMAMINYSSNDMDLQMRMPTGMTNTFSTGSSGFGDINISAMYKLFNKNRQEIHAQLGLSIPTGSIDAEDETPMSSPNEVVLPYPMQLGSGTVDPILGVTYLGQRNLFSWGSQLKGVFRLGNNSHDYHLGTRLGVNSWLAVRTLDWLSLSARIEGLTIGKIEGMDPNLNPMMVTTANIENSGGDFINSGLGANFYVPKGSLKDVRIGVEYSFPLYQNVNGIQLSQKNNLVLGIQYSL